MATFIIGGVVLTLIALAGCYVIKRGNHRDCCGGGPCGGSCCGCGTGKADPPGFDSK